MKVKYGEIPSESFNSYFEILINKTFKILPLKESETDTLESYLNSLLREIVGNAELVGFLKDEPMFISFVSILTYLATEQYDVAVCKQEVFKCIRLLKNIRERCFGGVDNGEIR